MECKSVIIGKDKGDCGVPNGVPSDRGNIIVAYYLTMTWEVEGALLETMRLGA